MKKHKSKTLETNGLWIQNQGKLYEKIAFVLVDEKNSAKVLR